MRFGNSISLPLTFANLAAGSGGAQLFTANGNHIAPRTGNYLVIAQGGGGGGGGAPGTGAASGHWGPPGMGGAAGQLKVAIVALNANDNTGVTIGAGQAGGAGGVGAANGADGTAGTNTVFGGLLTALGGAGGLRGVFTGVSFAVSINPCPGGLGGGEGGGLGGTAGTGVSGGNGANGAAGCGAGGGGGGGCTSAAGALNGGAGGNGSNGYLIVIPI